MRIGLLGGSFNPPHFGHLHISLLAIKILDLQQLWWLVCKNNPLKNIYYPPCDQRSHLALGLTQKFRKIKILTTDDVCTFKTLNFFNKKYPNFHFAWIMGADSVINFHKWEMWEEINNKVSILILSRENYLHRAMRSKFAIRFRENFRNFPLSQKRTWSMKDCGKIYISSTEIRNAISAI